jgi:prepilin-type N-terminal cleavage/methylation domain-containing protein
MLLHKSGFTLIELLVVLAVTGISLTLAVPSWELVSQKRSLTNATEQVAAFLAIAQTEAQKRNQAVSLTFNRTGDQDWCVGKTMGQKICDCMETDPASAQYCTIDGVLSSSLGADSLSSLKLIEAKDTQPTSGYSFITFDPVRGILQPVGDKLQLTFESTGGHYQLRLSISPTGLLKICNPEGIKMVGGYAKCVI